ncbi:MAG: pyruvate ferredoxin oxidoreductase [Candidatus Edwardsbacteria bacterium]|nr:pyruvate ferredoxin oxidoreductase [Candidatus Edwardsbacteria bacterium]MBU1575703.1 pyruvate ferredoxin oxidoreductase [Candidatus Edwardsbacteria bacterium]MBU2464098.1 pyruvate ferredoxin oxidoreductase [Candidatus Edwardsbacteria bacterium]MBU2594668.1 pyruvate ferredoxin oxidoreductase [Candidatus Edwardsbacteria bacterium]
MQKIILAKTGNEAMALAMKQINPDVVAAYPITPATEIVQIFSQYVADGEVKTEFVAVESEHSAMSACIGSAAAGARTMTGTSSQGLALMYEMVYIAAGLRLPIVIANVNRALSAPINIHCDHSDSMGCRDAGWIHIFSENAQEAYDNMIQAMRIAEHKDVRLPVMVTTDGFIISHGMERIDTLSDAEVQKFIGDYDPMMHLLDVKKPFTIGAINLTDYYFEHRRAMVDAQNNALKVIKEVGTEFGQKFDTGYDLIEKYQLDDAEVAIVALGSTCGTAKVVIDKLRKQGVKAGLLKVRVFRPFPTEEIVKALENIKTVAVLDRSDSVGGFGGPVFTEVRSALYGSAKRPQIAGVVYGLGGREIDMEMIEGLFLDLKAGKVKADSVNYLGVRE